MEVLVNSDKRRILNEGSRDNLLSIYLPLFQKKGMDISLSQLKRALLAKFVNEGSMNNLSLDSNYYLAGVAKYYFNGDLTTNKRLGIFYDKVDKFNTEICQRLNALIPILRNAYIDSVGTQFEQPEDFGELNINQLLRKYNKKINEELGIVDPKKVKEKPQELQKIDQSTNAGKDYTYEVIYDYEQCKKYKQYTDPGAWCITYGKQHYDYYKNKLKIHYVIFKKNGFENVTRKPGPSFTKRKPHDEYGNSLIALLQSNNDGRCVYITSRWNHGSTVDNTQGTEADHAYTPEEFLSIIGCDESVLQRCFAQWKEKIEQLKKEGKKDEDTLSRKEINARNLAVLRDFKYAQMKLNGGAKLQDIFCSDTFGPDGTRYHHINIKSVRGIEIVNPEKNIGKSICKCNLKCSDGEYYDVLVDKKNIIFETIRKNGNSYTTCKKYNNIIVYQLNNDTYLIYDLLRHRIVDFDGIKQIQYLNSDLSFWDVDRTNRKYTIFAVRRNQVCLFNTETCKFVKTPRGNIWYEKIKQEVTRYYKHETCDYSGHIKCFDVDDNDVLHLVYDSASGEQYYFDCQTNSFIDVNRLENELSEDGYHIRDDAYQDDKYEFIGNNYLKASKLVRRENKHITRYGIQPYDYVVDVYSYKYYNYRTNELLSFNGIDEFDNVKFEDDMIAFEPFDSKKVYFYNKTLDKLVTFDGKLFIGNGGNNYGHLGLDKDTYLDMYQLETNCQREGNMSYFYIPEEDYFYHDNINGYEFKYYGGGKVYKDKNDTSKNAELYRLPRKTEIISNDNDDDITPLFEKRHLILKENKTNMKSNIMKFLNDCEGWKTYIKNSHWSSSNMNEHKLFDDIADSVSEIQDMVAEIAQGLYGQIKKGELKGNKCNAKGSKDFLKVMLKGANDFYSTIEKGKDYIGMRSEMETFIGKISQFEYLMDLSLKEDFKRNFKNNLNENRNTIRLSENELKGYITECVKKILTRI